MKLLTQQAVTKEADMTNDEKMSILKLIFTRIFASKLNGTDITTEIITDPYLSGGQVSGRWFSDNTLRGYDVDISTGTSLVQIRCVEQNPEKRDNSGNLKWTANLAQQGHQLMWVIDRSQGGGFLGRMQKDLGKDEVVWHAGFDPATRPVAQAQAQAQYNQPTNYNQQDQPPMQNPAASQTNPVDIDDLPEIPNGLDIPDYVLESIAEMDEPPNWGDYE